MTITRRGIVTSSAAGVGIAVTGRFPSLAEARPGSAPGHVRSHLPFPPLVDDPRGILALPPQFSYRVMNRAGVTKLESGEPCPSNHDGTAVFGSGRHQYLILNHECDAGDEFGVPHLDGTVYDPGATGGGGCTVIRTDGHGRNLGQSVGISGTIANCAGGPTPWGTWWTCEEATARAGDAWEHEDTGATGVYQKDHGYVFEVFGTGQANPVPAEGARPLRPRGLRDQRGPPLRLPVRGRGRAERAVLPLAGSARLSRRARLGRPAVLHVVRQARGDGDPDGRRQRGARRGPPDLVAARAARSR